MTPAAMMVWLVCLAALVGGLAALAAAQWWSARQFPITRVFELTRELIESQQAIQACIERLSRRNDSGLVEPAPSHGSAGPAPAMRHRADQSERDVPPGPTLISVPDLSQRSGPASGDAAVQLAQRFGSIWDQAEAGQTPGQIARDTGLPIGQVELILGLKRQLGVIPTGETQ